MSDSEKLPDYKVVYCKRVDRKGLNAFWNEISELFEQGYRYEQTSEIKKQPTFYPQPKVTLFLKENVKRVQELNVPTLTEPTSKPEAESLLDKAKEVFSSKTPLEKELDTCKNLEEHKAFAKRYNIELPDDYRVPVVRKHIKQVINSKEFADNLN